MKRTLIIVITVFTIAALMCGCSALELLKIDRGEEPGTGGTAFVWHGYDLQVTEFYLSKVEDAIGSTSLYVPNGQIVVLTAMCTEGEIPTELLDTYIFDSYRLVDTAGTMDPLDAKILTVSYTGVGFDSETGTFSTDEMQPGFSISFDVPAGIDIHDFILCIDSSDGNSAAVEIALASIATEEKPK